MTNPRVALVYDRINSIGGAERILLALHDIFPSAPLFTSVYEKELAPWASVFQVQTSFLQYLPRFLRDHTKLSTLMPLAFEQFDLSEFDIVISVTSEYAKCVLTKPHTQHICYMLTPTRYLWTHSERYEHDFFRGIFRVLRPLFRWYRKFARIADLAFAQRPDKYVAISNVIQHRVQACYERVCDRVIYPPIQLDLEKMPLIQLPQHTYRFFLIVSRLVPYKRIDVAIRVCMKKKRHLIIIGKGSDENRLRHLAHHSSYIHFLGYLTEGEVLGYYQVCEALLMVGEEDFGLSAIEAMRAGRPAITHVKSGNAELIRDNVTGILIQNEMDEALDAGIERYDGVQWNSRLIREDVKKLDQLSFETNWRRIIYG
ncbi:MAG: Glycosyl transferase group 1 [Microgenomates group bacterium GW2011_GWF2_45_18]|nr:MAG: Glycosyl transferase group 1 [Microgenomates group bacterium GW2011_GWF1_44_10]KKU02340.1 MAG: Glycosyl transferase group 1 [Microgenomates group bacterium GW2011_GWF2_45_18]OGJ41672.1 MAG: hypothetical protein A2378_02205 [Candidatus Pacebacteria bacterium RIFOXYB1_FULL_44_10]HAU99193.1 hypothetical protein [Candidatus Paceibacterota bacterium]HAX01723.1 hypothetical protein [Candidatus Paceibacterota bacterium]